MESHRRTSSSSPRSRAVRRITVSPSPPLELVFTQSKGVNDYSRVSSSTSSGHGDKPRKRSSASLSHQQAELPESERSDSYASSTVSGNSRLPASIPNSSLLEHIATSRFFHHYVSTDRTFCRLDLDFTQLVIDQAAIRSSLAEVIIALGILTLPRKTEASCNAARLRYGRALRLTNRSIRNKSEAKSDEVLLAVILLSFFETTPDDRHTMDSWTAHLNGARLLLRIRGHKLLRSGPAYRMFNMLRQQVLVNCLITMQSVPEDLIDLSLQLIETQEAEERAGSEMMLLFARLCNLLAYSRNASSMEREAVLAQARSLDDDLVGWSLNRPSIYDYSTEPAAPGSNAYGEYCEVYASMFAAEVWMFYRTARLGLNGIIIEQQCLLERERGRLFGQDDAMSASSQHKGQQESAADLELNVRFAILESLRHDVCAGTPFMLGVHDSHSPKAVKEAPFHKRTPVMHQLMFILKTVGITPEMSTWVTAQVADLQSDSDAEEGGVYHAIRQVAPELLAG